MLHSFHLSTIKLLDLFYLPLLLFFLLYDSLFIHRSYFRLHLLFLGGYTLALCGCETISGNFCINIALRTVILCNLLLN